MWLPSWGRSYHPPPQYVYFKLLPHEKALGLLVPHPPFLPHLTVVVVFLYKNPLILAVATIGSFPVLPLPLWWLHLHLLHLPIPRTLILVPLLSLKCQRFKLLSF